MKRIKKKLVAVILAVNMLVIGIFGSYQTAQAAEFIGGAAAAEESLQFIFSIMAGMGMSVSLKEFFKPREAEIKKDLGVQSIDWDNYDWGDMLDSPAAQDQIDQTEKWINELYGNASETWKKKYHESLTPTPKPDPSKPPEISPPVTVPPIDPDSVTPPAWNDLKRAALKNKYLALGAATYWCLKEAVTGFWNKIIGRADVTDSSVPSEFVDLVSHSGYPYYAIAKMYDRDTIVGYHMYIMGNFSFAYPGHGYMCGYKEYEKYNGESYRLVNSSNYESGISYDFHSWVNNLPYFSSYEEGVKWKNSQQQNADKQPPKTAIWVNPNLKNDYDKNTSPSLPNKPPAPAIKVPTMDEIKDLQKKANNADDEKRPVIIQDFVTNHYTTPSVDPNPNPNPDPNPNPNPDPNPDPSPDPNPDPEPDPKPDPKPTTAPEEDTNVNPDDYKADLRLVFPFCIPFDLVHLIQAFEAEAQAPVFEFPLDLELENPWTGEKILDYHHTFELDMSDYEPVIKIFRIFEIIFFIIGLLMITRQHMIKG